MKPRTNGRLGELRSVDALRDMARKVFREIACGEPMRSIGELFGISRQRVDQILQRQKHDARKMTVRAIADETLERPDGCERCGRETDLEAHHKDYSRPLDVEFLCRGCHTGIHGIQLRREANRIWGDEESITVEGALRREQEADTAEDEVQAQLLARPLSEVPTETLEAWIARANEDIAAQSRAVVRAEHEVAERRMRE